MWLHTVKLATKNLLLHKLRSMLTVLGVILGVGSVIAMLAIGEGSKREALEQIRRLGAANVILRSVKPGEKGESTEDATSGMQQKSSRVVEYGLKYDDYDRMLATLPTVVRVLPVALVRKDVAHRHRQMANARILGTTPDFLSVKHMRLRWGRFLTAPDIETTANVAVLGADAALRLFGFEYPVGKPLLVGSTAYRIIGVMESRGGAHPAGAAGQDDLDTAVIVPLTAARLRLGELQVIRSSGSLDI